MSFYLGTAKSRHQPSLSTKMIPTGLGQRTTLIVEEAQADPQIIDPENELSALISPSATSKPVSMAVMPKKKAAVAPRRPYQLDAAQRMAWEQYLVRQRLHRLAALTACVTVSLVFQLLTHL